MRLVMLVTVLQTCTEIFAIGVFGRIESAAGISRRRVARLCRKAEYIRYYVCGVSAKTDRVGRSKS